MNLNEWRRLTVQSISLLLAAVVCAVCLSGGLQTKTKSTVLADSFSEEAESEAEKEQETTEEIQDSAEQDSAQEQNNSRKKIVVIDAGHGGMDEGTSSPDRTCLEKTYTLLISDMVSERLKKENIKVYCTRTSDTMVTKKERVNLAKKKNADLFVSIHCNASTEGDYTSHGVEVLYSGRKVKNSSLSNKRLAKILLKNLGAATGLKKRGTVRRENLYLLHYLKIPAAIVEIGFITNQDDREYIMDQEGQSEIVQGICNGIIEALNDMGE